MIHYLFTLLVCFNLYSHEQNTIIPSDFCRAHELMDTKDFKGVAEILPFLTPEEILKRTKKHGQNLFLKAISGKKKAALPTLRDEYNKLIVLMRWCGVVKNYKNL